MATGHAVLRARRIRTIAIALALACAAALALESAPPRAGAASSCDRVAALTGSDTAAGTEQQPFRTAARLVASLGPGQTGCLRRGSYREGVTLTRGGVAGAPIRLTSYPGEKVEIAGRMVIAANHVEVRHLRLVGTGAAAGASPLVAGDHVVLEDNEITNFSSGDCVVVGTPTRRVTDVAVRANRIHHCGVRPPTNRHNAISVENATGTQVIGNRVWENADRGVQLYPNADDSRVTFNVIDANGEGVLLGGDGANASDGNVVDSNIITGSRLRDNVESAWAPGGPVGQGNLVRWNCISGGARDDGDGGIADARTGFTVTRNVIADAVLRRPGGARLPAARHEPVPVRLRRAAHHHVRQGRRAGSARTARPGTATAPFATAGRLTDALAPGQTGCLRAGTYSQNLRIGRGGTAQAPITIASYPGERARLVGRLVVADTANFVNVVAARPRRNERRAPPEPDRQRRRRHVPRQRHHQQPHHRSASCSARTQYGRAARTLVAVQPHPQLRRATGDQPPPRHLRRGGGRRARSWTTGSTTTPTAACSSTPTPSARYIARNVIDSNGQGVIFSHESAGNIVEHNVISNAVLRWNIERDDLTGPGNVARRNCVWASGRITENGGVQPASEFAAVKNLIAEPLFAEPRGQGLPGRPRRSLPGRVHVAARDPGHRLDPAAPGREHERPWRMFRACQAYLSICAIYRWEGPTCVSGSRSTGSSASSGSSCTTTSPTTITGRRCDPTSTTEPSCCADWPMFPGQVQAYEHCIERARDDSRWIAFIDIDEFLFSPTGPARAQRCCGATSAGRAWASTA